MKRLSFSPKSTLFALLVLSTAVLAQDKAILTEDGGQPVGDNQNSRVAGRHGPVLLDNFHLIQKLARFDRERIPERVVHARGVGAHGVFESYGDLSKYTKARLFSEKGKKTPVFTRFSTVIHPKGSPEQLRDPRGFAVKFYTEEGNWDLVGNNLPVFFIRDAIKFPDMVHSLKPSPITNQQDPNRFFDFFSHVPESTHMLTFLYSDQGTPSNLRQMDGFGVHAFKLVNATGDVHYVKFNWRSLQGHKPSSAADAAKASAINHSGHSQDLYESIAMGKFPAWELRIQVLKPEQLDDFDFNPLDATKVWTGIKEIPVGKMTLNRVPSNFFQSTEQVAFSPGMVVPGIEPSEDRLLQGRLFSYADTQRYRLGANYLSLPINHPLAKVQNINQDGALNFQSTKSDVNYQPSVFRSSFKDKPTAKYSRSKLPMKIQQARIQKTLNFKQAGELYRSFTAQEQNALVQNFAGDLKKVKNQQVRLRILSFVYQADKNYGQALNKLIGEDEANIMKMIEANKNVDPTRWQSISISSKTSSDRIILRNPNAQIVRYQLQDSNSNWSKVYTLYPYQSHSYKRASLVVRLTHKPGEKHQASAGKTLSLQY